MNYGRYAVPILGYSMINDLQSYIKFRIWVSRCTCSTCRDKSLEILLSNVKQLENLCQTSGLKIKREILSDNINDFGLQSQNYCLIASS